MRGLMEFGGLERGEIDRLLAGCRALVKDGPSEALAAASPE
jgi:hypothetical protein